MPKKDDAIRTDVSAEADALADDQNNTDGEAKERPKSQRELGMEMMEARRRESLAGDGVVIDAEAQDTDVDEQIDKQIEDKVVAGDDAKDKKAEDHVDDPKMVTVKIDGKEELVPIDKVIAQYQKSNAADRRLEEATRLLEEARATSVVATTAKEKKAAEEAVEKASADLTEIKKKFSEALFGGNEQVAMDTLDEIINESVTAALKGRESATPDDAAIIARVTPAVEQSLAMKSALKAFQKDYPKIATDPYLATRADAFLSDAIAAGKAYDEAFKEAGEKTLGWMRDTLGLKSTVTVSTARTERTERKKDIDNPSSTSAKTDVPEAPIQQNVSQSIAEMRKARPTG